MEDKRPKYPVNQVKADNGGQPICCAVYAGPQDLTPITTLGYAGPDNGMIGKIGMTMSDYQKLMEQQKKKATSSNAKKPDPTLQPQGSENPEVAICPACGARVAKKGKFCPNCGAVLPWNN